jgi:hypothetical protein
MEESAFAPSGRVEAAPAFNVDSCSTPRQVNEGQRVGLG